MYVTLYRLVKQVGRILCTIRLYGDGDVRGGSPVRQSLSESSSEDSLVKSSQGRTSAPRERFRPEIPRAIVRARPVETIVRTRACLSVSYILCYILLTLSFFLAPARRLLRPSSFSWPSLSFSSIFSLRCVCFLCLFPSLSMHPSLYVFYSYSFFFFSCCLARIFPPSSLR